MRYQKTLSVKFEVPTDTEDGTQWTWWSTVITADVINEPENDWCVVDDIRIWSLYREDEPIKAEFYELPKEIQKRLKYAVEDNL